MDVGVYTYPLSDQLLIDKIVNEFLSQGKFDKLRKECMSDADTKPAYQNLQQRVENTVSQFLQKQVWKPDLNKNQLRDSLRKHILESGFFDAGINRIVDQVVNPNVLATVFMPEVEEVVYNYLSIPRPNDKNFKSGINNMEAKLLKHQSTFNEIKENENNFTDEEKKLGKFSNQSFDQESDKYNFEDLLYKSQIKHSNLSTVSSSHKTETTAENEKFESVPIIKLESKEVIYDKIEKMELTSDESQESFSKMTGKTHQKNVLELNQDSDDSVPLEINEKPVSDGENSDDSIMNQMSPISQGRLTPDILEERVLEVDRTEEKGILSKVELMKMNKANNENLISEYYEKRPSQFVGRIPKISRKDSESFKSCKTNKTKNEKNELKNLGSSDESDSNRNLWKNNNEEKKPKENHKSEVALLREDRKHKENSGKNKNFDQNYKDSKTDYKESHVCEKFKDKKEKKKFKNIEKHENKKCLRDVSSSQHKGHHKNSKAKEYDKKKKGIDKKKNKSTDDHSRERNKKEDRRSTDRDSNEREKDKSSYTRNNTENKNKERDHKATENRKDKQKESSKMEEEMETVPEYEGLMIEMDSDWVASEDIVFIPEGMVLAEEVAPDIPFPHLNYNDLYERGALTKINFPKLMDDFYVKFNSTGFKYFEEWEKTKMDCEEEFKEFVDEANNNLELISDEESESEIEKNFNFEEKNRKTITNLLKGLGNFRKAAMFDLKTSEFYRWTSLKFYRKFRRKCEERERKSAEKESDDSTKENIIQSKNGKVCFRKDQALHLKLLNKYKKRAMTQIKRKRKLKKRKDVMTYVNENANNSSFLNESVKKPFKTLAEEETWKTANEGSGDANLNGINSDVFNYGANNSLNFTESKLKIANKISCDAKSFISEEMNASTITQNLSFTLSLSPGSFEINADKSRNFCKKKILKMEEDEEIITSKKSKRNYSQKYDSRDLYKPRPVLNSTRSRGREKDVSPVD